MNSDAHPGRFGPIVESDEGDQVRPSSISRSSSQSLQALPPASPTSEGAAKRDKREDTNERPRQRRRRDGPAAASASDVEAASTAGPSGGSILSSKAALRLWLMLRHWTDKPCTTCGKSKARCDMPDAESAVEKCTACSHPSANKACNKKWFLEKAIVGKILKLTEEDGLSREEAEIIVLAPTGMLAGLWDKHKSYPGLDAALQRTFLTTSSRAEDSSRASTTPVVEAVPMRLATREAHKNLNWPEMDADMARKARKAFFRAYDVYHMMKPMTTDQIARAYDDLMHSMYEAYQTHGNYQDDPTRRLAGN